MKKNEISRKLVEIKILWWGITENKEYSQEDKEKLHKIIWKSSIQDIKLQLNLYEARIINAKLKLGVI